MCETDWKKQEAELPQQQQQLEASHQEHILK
jgi:hypothetical protein